MKVRSGACFAPEVGVPRRLAHRREVAARHADDVDQRARFPHEAIEEPKCEKLRGAFVPQISRWPRGTALANLAPLLPADFQGCGAAPVPETRPPVKTATARR